MEIDEVAVVGAVADVRNPWHDNSVFEVTPRKSVHGCIGIRSFRKDHQTIVFFVLDQISRWSELSNLLLIYRVGSKEENWKAGLRGDSLNSEAPSVFKAILSLIAVNAHIQVQSALKDSWIHDEPSNWFSIVTDFVLVKWFRVVECLIYLAVEGCDLSHDN